MEDIYSIIYTSARHYEIRITLFDQLNKIKPFFPVYGNNTHGIITKTSNILYNIICTEMSHKNKILSQVLLPYQCWKYFYLSIDLGKIKKYILPNLHVLAERQVTLLTGRQVTVECMITKFKKTFKLIFKNAMILNFQLSME